MAARAHICVFSDVAPKITKKTHDLHGHYLTVPGLIEFGDIGAVAALVAPHPQLVCVGANDPLTPPGASRLGKKKRLMHFVQRVLYFYRMSWQAILDLQNADKV